VNARTGKFIGQTLKEIAMLLLSTVIVIPFIMVLLNAVKNDREAATISLRLPAEVKWDNFRTVIMEGRLWIGFTNSVVFSVSAVLLVTLLAAAAAFVIQRRENALTKGTFLLFFSALILPTSVIPTIKILQTLQLYNTHIGVVLLYCAIYLPFSIFLFTGFYKSVPREIDEAGIIDGCGPLRLFAIIVLPLSKPVAMTQLVLVFMGVWNDFQWPLYLLGSSDKWTMPLSVFHFVSQYSSSYNLLSADLLLAAVPVVLLYVWVQRYMVAGITSGALKG